MLIRHLDVTMFRMPALAALALALVGCSSQEVPVEKKPVVTIPSKKVIRTALEGKALDGTLRGKVLYVGEPPTPASNPRIESHGDRAGCLEGSAIETHEQTWIVDP